MIVARGLLTWRTSDPLLLWYALCYSSRVALPPRLGGRSSRQGLAAPRPPDAPAEAEAASLDGESDGVREGDRNGVSDAASWDRSGEQRHGLCAALAVCLRYLLHSAFPKPRAYPTPIHQI